MCVLALGAGSTYLIEVNATVKYAKTSGKERVYTLVDF